MTTQERRSHHQEILGELQELVGRRVSLILNGGSKTIKGVVSFSGDQLLIDGVAVEGLVSFYNVIP